jgi:hypothetical protein
MLLPASALLALLPACSSDDDDDSSETIVLTAPQARIQLGVIGRYDTGSFDASACEIPAFCPLTDRLFVVNANDQRVDVLDLSDPTNPTLIISINCTPFGGGTTPNGAPNGIAIHAGVLAIAVENGTKTDNGEVVFFNTSDATFSTPLATYTAGALPDMVTFTPNGNFVLVANEGEPNDAYTIDPEGSVTIVNVAAGIVGATVTTATFTSFNAEKAALIASGVRIFGPGSDTDGLATVAQDVEPEYIAISADSSTAYVALQENNAIAVVNIATATVTQIMPLGYKDHMLPGMGLDPSDEDGPGDSAMFNVGNWPVRGFFMPDAIACYEVGGQRYIISANEGDARDYGGYSEEVRVKNAAVVLDATAFPNAAALKTDAQLGRLNITTANGTNTAGEYEALYCYGARSITIWRSNGQRVWDSGEQMERITWAASPNFFNASNTDNELDSRSDNKGPEPEGLAMGEIDGRHYVFVGLERVGGIMVWDVTNPSAPWFQTYINPRDFNTPATSSAAGDLGPEGLVFVPAADSPNGKDLLIVGNEVSGTVTIFQVSKILE